MRLLENYEGLVFIHPMKTAMTSVSSFVKEQLKKYYGSYAWMPFTGHYTPDEMIWRFRRPAGVFDKYYNVMFTRNPYDRLVSFYHHMRQIGGHAEGICERLSFREFALYPRVREIMRPMADYLYCEEKQIINFLGKYESLTEDVYRLIDILGFGELTQTIKNNWLKYARLCSTEHKPYEQYYDKELKDSVYFQYEADFREFEYGR